MTMKRPIDFDFQLARMQEFLFADQWQHLLAFAQNAPKGHAVKVALVGDEVCFEYIKEDPL